MGKFRKAVSIVLLLIIILFVCTACNNSGVNLLTRTPDLDKQYMAEMRIQAGEFECCCTVKRFGIGFWEMSVESPDTIAGLSVVTNSEGVKAKFDGLELDISADDIRDKAIFSLIFKAFDNAAVNKLYCEKTEDGLYYEGEFGGVVYGITFDGENLKPLVLEIPEAEFVAEIKGFETLDEMEEKGTLTQTYTKMD